MIRNLFLAAVIFLLAACVSTGNRSPYAAQIAQLDSDYRAGKIAAADYYGYRNKLSAQEREWQACMEKAAIRESIDAVLQQTAQCQRGAERASSNGVNQAKIAGWLTGQMQQIDTSRCPNDFRVVYQMYIDSIEKYAEMLSERSFVEDIGPLVIAFGRACNGDISGAWSDVGSAADQDRTRRQVANEYLRNIGESWLQVKEIAIRYGANP